MKKNQQRPPGPRRTKTNDQVRQENRQRGNQSKRQEAATPAPRWEELKSLHNSCQQYLQLPSKLAPLLRDEELMGKVSNPNELKRLMYIVARDVEHYSQELTKIENEWKDRYGKVSNEEDDLNEVMEAIMIGQKYDNWYHSFTSVVMPNFIEAVEMINVVLPQNQKISTEVNG